MRLECIGSRLYLVIGADRYLVTVAELERLTAEATTGATKVGTRA